MPNTELIQSLKNFFEEIKCQKKIISLRKTTQITSQRDKNDLNSLAQRWFENYSKTLPSYGLDENTVSTYDKAFREILILSSSNNRVTSYEKQFEKIIKSFNEDIIIFLQTEAHEPTEKLETEFSAEIKPLLDKVPNKSENDYLKEASGCWEHGFLKAAVVLAWCAAIDRIHLVIEQNGFDVFNKASASMKSQTKGRFKNFNSSYNISSISELRTVFDRDVLWILEGMQLIDGNERVRLVSCFDMRCHSGHPGAAPITKYNVLSCFSDIIEIVLANPKFQINNASKSEEV